MLSTENLINVGKVVIGLKTAYLNKFFYAILDSGTVSDPHATAHPTLLYTFVSVSISISSPLEWHWLYTSNIFFSFF